MPTVCFECKSHNRECRLDVCSGRCAECTQRGRKCDLLLTRAEFDKARKVRSKLLAQVVEAEDEEGDLMTQMEELQDKLSKRRRKIRRLRKQLRLSEHTEGKAFDAELADIEAAEELERLEQSHAGSSTTLDLPDHDGSGVTMSAETWAYLDQEPWDFLTIPGPGVSSETPVEPAGG